MISAWKDSFHLCGFITLVFTVYTISQIYTALSNGLFVQNVD